MIDSDSRFTIFAHRPLGGVAQYYNADIEIMRFLQKKVGTLAISPYVKTSQVHWLEDTLFVSPELYHFLQLQEEEEA